MSVPILSLLPLRAGLVGVSVAISILCIGFFESRPAPAAARGGATVPSVDAALRVAVMIEGDGIYGAGILIDPQRGLVLTNQHVVQDMHTPRVTGYNGYTSTAVVLARDSKHDLALLSAPALVSAELPPRLGDAAALRPGEEVYAIGMPRKLSFSVSRGVVSFVGREVEGVRYLQLDMNINDGNSGGPVVNSAGEIVGVMSFIYRHAQGLSFAVPTSEVVTVFPSALPVIPSLP